MPYSSFEAWNKIEELRFSAHYNIKHITGKPYNTTGQAVIKKFNHTLKDKLNKEKGVIKIIKDRLHNALLTLKF